MPPPPHGRKEQWIQDYNNDKMEEQSQLNTFIAAENERRLNDPSPNNQPHLTVLLPEFDPKLLTPISRYQRADWDETHPKTRLGVIMKGGKEKELVF
jgi:hypothetical protein